MALCKLASSFGMVTILSVFSAVACSSVDADPEASSIGLAQSEIAAALAATSYAERSGHTSNAVSRVENARDQVGANITFTLGAGNLMF